ncbi:hypothetical protein ACFQV2_18780 [Actinokineospora soli]|uniref:Uncharacterized protein n=1 Tax=Actinokineospora soli TaxID=1048753 RepID=A0ABW2TN80_9PSEU
MAGLGGRRAEEATTTLRVLSGSAVPWAPGPVVCVAGAVIGGTAAASDAEDLLGPLRAIAKPLRDTWRSDGPAAPLFAHEHPAGPRRTVADHLLLDEIGRDGVLEFLRVAGEGSGSPLLMAELRNLGGALAEPDPAGGLLDSVDARFAYVGCGSAVDAGPRRRAWSTTRWFGRCCRRGTWAPRCRAWWGRGRSRRGTSTGSGPPGRTRSARGSTRTGCSRATWRPAPLGDRVRHPGVRVSPSRARSWARSRRPQGCEDGARWGPGRR